MKGSDLLKKTLEEHGVKYIFGILGREAQYIQFNKDDKLKFILVHHEQTSAIMAEAYARITGRPQVCFSTMGPGVTNMLTGVASAYKEKSPLLAIGMQCETKNRHNCTHQYINNVNIMKPITKYSSEIEDINKLPYEVYKCFEIMMAPPLGPCFLSIPVDILSQEYLKIFEKPLFLKKQRKINKLKLEKLNEYIHNSNQPLIIAGYESLNNKLPDLIKIFAESYNIPVATTLAGKGVIPDDHKLSLGAITKYYDLFFKTDLKKEIFKKIDLIIFIGSNWAEDFPTIFLKKHPCQKICRINSHHDGIENVFPLDLDVFESSIQNSLNYLLSKNTKPKNIIFDIEKIKHQKRTILDNKNKNNKKLDPFALINVIRENLNKDDIVVVDVGMHKHITGLAYEVLEPLTYFGSNSLATMGFSLPAAIGIKLAKPEKTVVAVCGDGGLYSVFGELETCMRNNINIVIVVFKDNSYGLIRHYNSLGFDGRSDCIVKFNDVNISQIAAGFGMNSKRIDSNLKFKTCLIEAKSSNSACLLEVPLQYPDFKSFT